MNFSKSMDFYYIIIRFIQLNYEKPSYKYYENNNTTDFFIPKIAVYKVLGGTIIEIQCIYVGAEKAKLKI